MTRPDLDTLATLCAGWRGTFLVCTDEEGFDELAFESLPDGGEDSTTAIDDIDDAPRLIADALNTMPALVAYARRLEAHRDDLAASGIAPGHVTPYVGVVESERDAALARIAALEQERDHARGVVLECRDAIVADRAKIAELEAQRDAARAEAVAEMARTAAECGDLRRELERLRRQLKRATCPYDSTEGDRAIVREQEKLDVR